ncbi:MAG: sensor domain-containing diguanylate cyclase [Lachnospiraceae bacterium]|nr:sensor domain-containing diguanylate cyclase [Lachnospiraceae bacterium]
MNNKNEIKFLKKGRSYYAILLSCFVVFVIAIYMLISGFNSLITKHDEKLSQEICTLLSEKMGTSLLFMTDSAHNVATVLSEQNFNFPDEIYKKLESYNSGEIVGLGFIDETGKIYHSEADAKDFEKKNLAEVAKQANPVSISEPYRSSRLGQPVITLFTEFNYAGSHKGYICLTYMFRTLQDIATTQSLNNDIEIWLMNAKSANIIQCVGRDIHASGSWANAYLKMGNINPEDKDKFNNWYDKMHDGDSNASVSYKIGETKYSQVYSKIDSMPGWFVVVRIPSNALSETMGVFRNNVIIFIIIFLMIVAVIISVMYVSWKREKRILEQLSINDALTGVLNRRAFEISIENMIFQSKGGVVIFFDLDFFKQINDGYGHDAGDKLLVTFSTLLRDSFENNGIVSRFGGDEFVVLTDESSKDKVNEIMERLRKEVNEITIDSENADTKDANISFSAGLAVYPKDAKDVSELLKCADQALYEIKEAGRNGYRWYEG